MSFINTTLAIVSKDLRCEWRSKEIVLSSGLFALLVVLLSAFSFGLNTAPAIDAATGVLWLAVAFSGILALTRAFMRERENGVWNALLMSPVPRSALYLGKATGIAVFLLVVELLLLPFIELFFHAPLLEHILPLLPILLLATTGYAAIGTLFGTMTIRTRLRDVLLGVILFPLLAPILIAAQKATVAVLLGDGLSGAGDYIELLVITDAIYLIGGLWLFGPMMEE